MKAFGKSARYYDLLYRDKNYAKEAQFVHELLQQYAPGARSILELGCGSGIHAVFLAREAYEIQGFDFSTKMINLANSRLGSLPPDQAARLSFRPGDIRAIRLNSTFDAVIALFHVMSYQITNNDLKATLATAKVHLKSKGIFIFDCWYGPAVLTERPNLRIKRMEDKDMSVTRLAEPEFHPNHNVVDIKYQFIIEDKLKNAVEIFNETHKMRYLFKPEIDLLLAETNFELLDCGEWITRCELGFDTWNVYFVVRNLESPRPAKVRK
jgi:SAM-dependent methyltransferase